MSNLYEQRVQAKALKEGISEDEARRLIDQEIEDRLAGKYSSNPKRERTMSEPGNFFEQRVQAKALKEGISEDEARRLIDQEIEDRLAGKYSSNPKRERTMSEPGNFFEQRVQAKALKEGISEDEARRLIDQEIEDRLAGKYSSNPKRERTMSEPGNFFEQRVQAKALKEGISEDEAKRLLIEERNERLSGKYSTNPKRERKMSSEQDDNVHDLFGAKPKQGTSEEQSKKAQFEQILNDYEFHLTAILNYGSYGNCHEPAEVAKMADIRSCINKSAHLRIKTIESLFTQVVGLIKKLWGDNGYAQWAKAINDELEHRQILDNLNALTCSTAQWSDRDSEGKLKPPILRAIVAIRYLLEQRRYVLREDSWRSYSVITDEKDNELYVSKQTDSILREWRNWIYERKGIMHTQEIMKDAYHQVSKVNEFHSQQEKIKSVMWDGVGRYAEGTKAMGLDDSDFTTKVFRQHLIASAARLFYPGVWYDLILCVFGYQGAGKTTGLRILYGRDNAISRPDFFDLDDKKKSEITRHGCWSVEVPDIFPDARKDDFNKIKAQTSIDSLLNRDAYGRVEDMRRHDIMYVIWYTGNEVKVLRDPTGNRRYIIVYSIGPTDEDWLRLNVGQLWAQAYADMMKLRAAYLDAQRAKGIVDDYHKYLELPRDLWDESKRRSDAAMKGNDQLGDWVPDIILQDFVIWPSAEKTNSRAANKISILVFTRDIEKYLREKLHRVSISDQDISHAMTRHIVLPKTECKDLNEDVKWKKAQIDSAALGNLRGYRLDFAGEIELRALAIIKKLVADYKSPEEAFIGDDPPL